MEKKPEKKEAAGFKDTSLPEVLPAGVARTAERIRKVGRPPRYSQVDEMIPIIEEFFEYCLETGRPPLVTSLALALGFTSRNNLDDYQAKPEFHDVIKRAKLVCEDYAARGLVSGKNTIGFIFLLKQHGWKDVQENIHTVETHEQRIARLIRDNGGGRSE